MVSSNICWDYSHIAGLVVKVFLDFLYVWNRERERWDDLCPCQTCVDLLIAALLRLKVVNWYLHLSCLALLSGDLSSCYTLNGCYLSSKCSSDLLLTSEEPFRWGQEVAVLLTLRMTLWIQQIRAVWTIYILTGISRQISDFFLGNYTQAQQFV